MKVFITGGTGFIGSHTAVELLNEGHEVIIIDNFSNSKRDALDKIKKITGKDFLFYEGNVCDKAFLRLIFAENKIDVVIDFAGYKAVGESALNPLKYYENNLVSTISLCEVMKENDVKKLVFSSSATVYGTPKELPIRENAPLSTTNPYGSTKLFNEHILRDLAQSDPSFSIALLRYFNPIGAHASGLLFENPNGIPNNLMPYIVKVAKKELPFLQIFGDDYDTHDGTGVRDYIHVVDLAKGHVLACKKVMESEGVDAYNLGTGVGYSVLDLVKTFCSVNHIEVPYKIVGRREGDIPSCYADPTYAYEKLGFKATKNIEDMCRDAYFPVQDR